MIGVICEKITLSALRLILVADLLAWSEYKAEKQKGKKCKIKLDKWANIFLILCKEI
ncbi:hypothetical protein [Caldithrix abyssi]|uniref:Uncharacterized protein n=1 Tax=Caldithrix abyssi DSM 13497 TaxID=880073 RepID=A0A1J1CDE3_CALAY|nr:hypothetical protein [Caldithrix abyssi]APF20741.1 hypothetical protein Cabys_3996 [Caldithrix abyssi DSM 13497]